MISYLNFVVVACLLLNVADGSVRAAMPAVTAASCPGVRAASVNVRRVVGLATGLIPRIHQSYTAFIPLKIEFLISLVNFLFSNCHHENDLKLLFVFENTVRLCFSAQIVNSKMAEEKVVHKKILSTLDLKYLQLHQ